jgi:hypothetical protein
MENVDALAKVLYEAYGEAVGGHSAVTNAPLPSWEDLFKDDKKVKVIEGWRAVAIRARQPESAFATAPVGGTEDSNAQLSVEGDVPQEEAAPSEEGGADPAVTYGVAAATATATGSAQVENLGGSTPPTE